MTLFTGDNNLVTKEYNCNDFITFFYFIDAMFVSACLLHRIWRFELFFSAEAEFTSYVIGIVVETSGF